MFAHMRGAASETLGQIVPVSGSINSISRESETVSLGYGSTYGVANTSVLIINGKRGNILDLTVGMKVNGSAEITAADEPHMPLKKIIRMLNANTDPAYVKAHATPTPSQNPQGAPVQVTQEEREEMKKKLSGTFWTVPVPDMHGGTIVKQWLSLNADGTATSEKSGIPGHWYVFGALIIQVQYFTDGPPGFAMVRFNAELNKGEDVRLSHRPPMMYGGQTPDPEQMAWTRIDSPTEEMQARAAQHSTPGSNPGPVAHSGAATASPAPTPTPAPVAVETQHTAAEIIKANHNNLVFVTGKEGAGSGFIASMDGATFLVTNAHVAAGISNADFKTLDGTAVKGGAATVAVGHDIFRMMLPPGGKPFEVMKGVDENAGVGDDVVVLGNAEGSGVINTIIGKIVGIGPNLVEIDAQFVPGNSGSPIVHLKTGKVIGVATYTVTQKYDATTKEKMKAPVVRRFGYRLDSVKTWQPVNWQTFYAQANAMERIHTLTEDLGDFFRDLAENKGAVTIGRHTNPIIKTRIDQWQESKGRGHSLIDRQNANANFLSFLKIACQSDISGIQRSLTYDYFQRRLAEEQQARTEMSQAFSDIIKENRE
jgi:hypothetical protein